MAIFPPKSEDYQSPWQEAEESEPMARGQGPQSSAKWVVRLLVALILLGGGAGYYFYFRGPARPNLSLEFSKPSQILVGQPFTVTVSFSNYSDNVLKDAKLSVFLPEGVSFVGQFADQRVVEQAVGDLGPGSLNQQKFNLIITSGSQTLKHLEAKLAYSLETNAKVQFENAAEVDLLVSQPAVSLTLETPENVFNGEDFDMTVRYENQSSEEFKNLRIKLDYPPVFQFKKSNATLEGNSNNVWSVPALRAGEKGELTITGNVLGPEGSFFTVGGTVTADFLGQTYALNTQAATVGITQAPLSLKVSVNGGGADYIARAGEFLRYAAIYKNNADIAFQNITIRAKLVGSMFDFASLATTASFNSLSNTLTWFAANTPDLTNLSPGEERTLEFQVKLKENFPIQRLSDKNFTLRVQADIESSTVPPGTAASKTVSVASLETKIGGKIIVDAQAYWRDAASGILNSGPYPPQVNRGTEYSVHWVITNYSTDVGNVKVSAYLQSGSWFTGKVKSNTPTQPVFESEQGLVTWDIPNIPATKGIVGAPLEAVFQIEGTPAVNQLGLSMPLVGETKLEAKDLFTDLSLTATDAVLTTDLPDDKTITVDDRRVKP